MFEVGYKCLLFEEDAEVSTALLRLPVLSHRVLQIAHRELGVHLSKEGNIPTAMVTMERRGLHLKKLVQYLLARVLVLIVWC
jgi:hypothetical protein